MYVRDTREFAYIAGRRRSTKEAMSLHLRGQPARGMKYGVGFVHRDTVRHRWTRLHSCDMQPWLNVRRYNNSAVVISEPEVDVGYIVHSAISTNSNNGTNTNGRPATTRIERMQCDCFTLTRA